MNDSERLMRCITDAITAFYADDRVPGPVEVSSVHVLHVLAILGGAVVHGAPVKIREATARDFIDDFATHAGYVANVDLEHLQ